MKQTDETWKKLADSLVANLSSETIKQMAEIQLKAAMESYDVQNTIKEALKEPIKDAIGKVVQSTKFGYTLSVAVEKQILALIEPSVIDTLRKLNEVFTQK